MTLAIWLLSFWLPAMSDSTPAFTAAPPASCLGFWLGEDRSTVVEISRQGDYYVGRYVAFRKDPASAQHQAQLSTYALKEMRPNGQELLGKIVDGKSGKEYNGTLRFTGPNTVEVRVKAMGLTAYKETWTRQVSAR